MAVLAWDLGKDRQSRHKWLHVASEDSKATLTSGSSCAQPMAAFTKTVNARNRAFERGIHAAICLDIECLHRLSVSPHSLGCMSLQSTAVAY